MDSDGNASSEYNHSEKIFNKTDKKQINDLRAGLFASYERQQFTDVTLIIESREMNCHRNVLAAMSPFFSTMFSCDFSEKYQKQISLPYIEKFDIMSTVLKYMYTGDITFVPKEDNILLLYLAANFLQLDSLVKFCISFIVSSMDKINCLSMLQFAFKYDCVPVREKAKQIICEDFVEISKQEQFLCLDIDLIREIVQWDELKTDNELHLLECCLNWLQKEDVAPRDQFSASLLNCVKFPSLDLPGLRTALSDALVLKTLHPVDICKLKRILKYPFRKGETDLTYTCRTGFGKEECIVALDFPKRSNFNKFTLATENTLYVFNLSCCLNRLDCRLPEATCFAEICLTGGGQIYVTGLIKTPLLYSDFALFQQLLNASDDETRLNHLQHKSLNRVFYESGLFYFNEDQEFLRKPSMRIKRKKFSFVAIDNNLFAIGGQSTEGQLLRSVEMYHTVKEKWHSMPSLPISIKNPCALGFKGKLYVFGGDCRDGISSRVFCYCKSKKFFEELPSLQRVRSGACAAIFRREIYVIGGVTRSQNGKRVYTRSVEIFDVRSNAWKTGPNLPYSLKKPNAIKDGESIIVMGLKKSKLQAYILKNFAGQDRWIRHYFTPAFLQLRTNFKCASMMVTKKKSFYNFPNQTLNVRAPEVSNWFTSFLVHASDVDDDNNNDAYDQYSPFYDEDEDDYFDYDS